MKPPPSGGCNSQYVLKIPRNFKPRDVYIPNGSIKVKVISILKKFDIRIGHGDLDCIKDPDDNNNSLYMVIPYKNKSPDMIMSKLREYAKEYNKKTKISLDLPSKYGMVFHSMSHNAINIKTENNTAHHIKQERNPIDNQQSKSSSTAYLSVSRSKNHRKINTKTTTTHKAKSQRDKYSDNNTISYDQHTSHSNTNHYNAPPPPPNVTYDITSNHNSTMRPSITHHNNTISYDQHTSHSNTNHYNAPPPPPNVTYNIMSNHNSTMRPRITHHNNTFPYNPYSSHSNTNNLNYSQMSPYQPPNVIYNMTSNHNSTMRPSITHHNSTMRPSITHHNSTMRPRITHHNNTFPYNSYSSHSNTNNLNYSQMPPYQPPNVICNMTSNNNSIMMQQAIITDINTPSNTPNNNENKNLLRITQDDKKFIKEKKIKTDNAAKRNQDNIFRHPLSKSQNEEIAKRIRGTSTATTNCALLAVEMMKFYQKNYINIHEISPMKYTGPTTSNKDFSTIIQRYDTTNKIAKVISNRDGYHEALPLNAMHDLTSTGKRSEYYTDLRKTFSRTVCNKKDAASHIRQWARSEIRNQRNSKSRSVHDSTLDTVFGTLGVASSNSTGGGHEMAFYYNPLKDEIFYTDLQAIMKGKGDATFSSIDNCLASAGYGQAQQVTLYSFGRKQTLSVIKSEDNVTQPTNTNNTNTTHTINNKNIYKHIEKKQNRKCHEFQDSQFNNGQNNTNEIKQPPAKKQRILYNNLYKNQNMLFHSNHKTKNASPQNSQSQIEYTHNTCNP